MRRELAGEVGISSAVIPPLPNFDSNVITPGTLFMARLAAALREFLQKKLLCDPAWRHVMVSRRLGFRAFGFPGCVEFQGPLRDLAWRHPLMT